MTFDTGRIDRIADRNDKWDRRFMELATLVGSWSKDPSTKVGSIIVDYHRRVIGLGYNGFPRYVGDDMERYHEKMVKYKMIVHAEANAILNAAVSVRQCALYATKSPCSECVKLIIQSCISTVISPPPATDGSVWAEDASFATTMLREAGIAIVHV